MENKVERNVWAYLALLFAFCADISYQGEIFNAFNWP